MTNLEFAFLALSSLFVIVDPIATVPVFLAITPDNTPAERKRVAGMACIIMATILLCFAVAGGKLLELLGITLPAFQIAGSIVLLLIALDMLRAQRSRVQTSEEDTAAGAAREDVAVTPLAIPMLAGPGAISSVILLHNRAASFEQQMILWIVILAIAVITYVIFQLSVKGASWLNPIVMRIATRIMGLLLAAVAVQFMVNGVREIFPR